MYNTNEKHIPGVTSYCGVQGLPVMLRPDGDCRVRGKEAYERI